MWIGGLAVLGFAALAVPNCSAQCGMGPAIRLHSSLRPRMGDAQLRPVAFGDRSEERERHGDRDPIVGFWHVTFTAKTMNGTAIPETVIDNALVVWHSDGTEIMNSGRPPQDGNFCLGVWEQTGPSTYKLNHFALGNEYTPGTPPGVVGDPAGPTRFVETARVASDGNHYSGTFTLTSHDASGQPTNPTFTGVITATRISLDTTVADIL
jgi:hypothetical protein